MENAVHANQKFNVLAPLFTATQVLELVNQNVRSFCPEGKKPQFITMDDWQNWRRQGRYKAYTDYLVKRPQLYCALDAVALSTIVCLHMLGVPVIEAARLSRVWNIDLGLTLEYETAALLDNRRFHELLDKWPECQVVYCDGDYWVSEPWISHFDQYGTRVQWARGNRRGMGAYIMVHIKAITKAAVCACERACISREQEVQG